MSSIDLDDEEFVALIDEITDGVEAVMDAFDSDEDVDVTDKLEDLWDTLDNFEDLLGEISLRDLPETVEVSEVPDAVDIEENGDGATLDLSGIQDAIRLRELWEAVDMTDAAKEYSELEEAMDSLLGDGEIVEDDDIEMPSIGSDPATRQAYAEEAIETAAEGFREVLLATHEQFHQLYRENQERFGQEGRQPRSKNPTAVSTMPPGPLPDSASTRQSTVPTRVRHSSATYHPPRIYGRRFRRATTEEDNDSTEQHNE